MALSRRGTVERGELAKCPSRLVVIRPGGRDFILKAADMPLLAIHADMNNPSSILLVPRNANEARASPAGSWWGGVLGSDGGSRRLAMGHRHAIDYRPLIMPIER